MKRLWDAINWRSFMASGTRTGSVALHVDGHLDERTVRRGVGQHWVGRWLDGQPRDSRSHGGNDRFVSTAASLGAVHRAVAVPENGSGMFGTGDSVQETAMQ
jgi:hypothetical protein